MGNAGFLVELAVQAPARRSLVAFTYQPGGAVPVWFDDIEINHFPGLMRHEELGRDDVCSSYAALWSFGFDQAAAECIDAHITAARLTWVRWDFNIEPLGFWRRNDPPDRQGITEIRHLERLYAMWAELQRRHPGLPIDNCSSGGRCLDIEAGRYGLPLWHSDLQCEGSHPAADQLQNGAL